MSYRQPEADQTVICDSAAMLERDGATLRHPQVVVVEGDVPGQQIALTAEIVHIGREEDNDLVLQATSVSRRHAALKRQGSGYAVCDIGAANGVFVNAQRLQTQQTQPLAHGDSLILGTVRLLYLDPDHARPDLLGNDADRTQRQQEANSWIKRIYAIDPLAEND